MLSVDNLTFRYSRFSHSVLNGASLSLNPGEIGILLGKKISWALRGPEVAPSPLRERT